MVPGFFAAATYPVRGLLHLLRTPRLWKLALLPFLVNLVLYTLIAAFLFWFVSEKLLGDWLSGWPSWARWIAGIVAVLSALALMAFSFTILGNIVASPLLDFLAERALADLRGRPLPEGGPWYVEAVRSVGRQILKLVLFGGIQLVLLLVLLIPVVGVVHPVLSAVVTIFFLALEYLEYPLAADRVPFCGRFGYLFRHFRTAFGLGGSLFVIVLIPIVGYFALPACVVGATLLYRDLELREGEGP